MDDTREAAACLVVMQGALDHHWVDYLGNLTISARDTEGPTTTTILAGPVLDFAAFVGLISRLQNLGLPVQTISFHRLPASTYA